MSHRLRTCLAALALVLCARGAVHAAAAQQLKLGADYVAEVDERGVVAIRKGDAPVVREVFLGTWVADAFFDQLKAIKTDGFEREGMIVRRGLIPRPGANEKYQVFVRATPPGPDGLRDLLLTYTVETPLFPTASAAALVRFPVKEFTGKTVSVGETEAGVFPDKLAANNTLALRRGVHDLLITADKKPVLFIGREAPGDILVQDARKWGADAYEAQFHLAPTRSEPPERRTLTLLLSVSGRRGPTIARIETNRPSEKPNALSGLPQYALFEITLDLWARFDNPYDSDDIEVAAFFTQPDKTVRRIRGFFYQPFERELDAGNEKLTPVGPHQWRVRFTPTQLGEHSFKITVKTKTGTLETKPAAFSAVKGAAPGYISVNQRNKKYFQFTNGATYFAVGHNVCWGSDKKLSYDYDTYFRRMSNAEENYTRVWMCSWDTGIEGNRLDNYRLDAAWRLDYIINLAEERGIYVKLCLDNEHDYSDKNGKRKHFGCWKENGGPCSTILDFFTLPDAKAAYKRRLDYILARWGHSPHIMAWELWNEMNYIAATDAKARGILIDWTAEIARYLKENDPYRHMVTTSLGLLTVWDEVWRLEDIDFAQIHAYLPQPDAAKEEHERDAALAVLRAGERLAGFAKPYHVSEFGYLDLNEVNRSNEKDPNGIHLHNAIWGGLFSGAAATPAIWWWKEYVHDKSLYGHYGSAARFLRGIDLADPGWKQIVAAGAGDTRVLGIKKPDRCALWIQKKGNDWYSRTHLEKPLVPLGTVKVRVPDVERGNYTVTWWDTSNAEITHYPQAAAPRPGAPGKYDLLLEYTTGRPDIAVKVEKVK